jgi:protein-S-isoprenylcysteine O-methyltransferase Ste14
MGGVRAGIVPRFPDGLVMGGVVSDAYSVSVAFGVAATGMLFLAAGVERFPVTHHMALPAGLAALALPEASPVVAVLVGGAFGVVGGLVGELAQRIFYAHGDTHFDPPSASILVTTLLIAVLDLAGLFQQTAVPTVGIA